MGVNLHTPTKFGEDPSKDLGGNREQTNTQTNAARIIVWLSPGSDKMSMLTHTCPLTQTLDDLSDHRQYQADCPFY